jgi:CRP-like cAMP-binding protein
MDRLGTARLFDVDARSNRLLGAFGEAHWHVWHQWLEPVRLRLGEVLYQAGEQVPFVYFPVSATVSLHHMLANGSGAQVSVVGCEGLVGESAFLGGGTVLTRAVVQSGGTGTRIDAEVARAQFLRGEQPMHLLLRYVHALMAQMVQTAVCNRHHNVEQQLCRWLLLSLDRLSGQEIVSTQELIAIALGVRRETVVEAAQKLQRRGVIQYRRGHIQVLNRAELEVSACECYGQVKAEYDRLLPPS